MFIIEQSSAHNFFRSIFTTRICFVSKACLPFSNFTYLLSFDPPVESVDDVELSMAAVGGTGCTSCNGGGCVACVNEFRVIVLPNNAENTNILLSNLLSSEDLGAQKDLLEKTAKHHGMLSGLYVEYHASSAGYYPNLFYLERSLILYRQTPNILISLPYTAIRHEKTRK